jgi:hypothetical protein
MPAPFAALPKGAGFFCLHLLRALDNARGPKGAEHLCRSVCRSMDSEELQREVFITDDEFETLFGPQVAQAVSVLDKYADEVCAACGGECCQRIRCGFFSAAFGSCPIHGFRPAKCRLYYCDRVLDNPLLSEQERQLLGQPARDVSRIVEYNYGLEVLLSPPIRIGEKDWLAALGIEAEVQSILRALENGGTDGGPARADLMNLIQRCRNRR